MPEKKKQSSMFESPHGRMLVLLFFVAAITFLLVHALTYTTPFTVLVVAALASIVLVAVPTFLALRKLEERGRRLSAEVEERARAEQDLRESEAKYRAVAQSFPDGAVLMFDEQQRFVIADGAGLTRFGFDPGDLLGRTPSEAFAAGLATTIGAAVEAALDGMDSVFDISYWGRLVQMHVLPVSDSSGTVAGMVVVRDVTEARLSERALAEGERRMSTIIGNMTGMVYRCVLDEKHTMEFVSEGCRELTGYAPADLLLNRRVSWLELVHPEDLSDMRFGINRAVHEARPYSLSYRIRTSSGVEKWVRERGVSVYMEEGNFLMLEGIVLDITNEKLAEDRLQDAFSELDQIFNSTGDGLSLLDLDLRLVRANRTLCRMFGFSQSEVLGKPCSEAIGGEDCDTPLCPVQQIRDGAERVDNEYSHMAEDGTERQFEVTTLPFRNTQGATVGYLSSVREITDRVRAEQQARDREYQLVQADRRAALGTLVTGVAHEINNPNTIISLNAPILRSIWEDVLPILDRHHAQHGDFPLGGGKYSAIRDEVIPLATKVVESSRRIRTIVLDLKGFARQDATTYDQEVDLCEVVRAGAGLVDNMIRNSTQAFSLDLSSERVVVQGQFQRLEQVVVNALINACEALSSPVEAISVVVMSEGEWGVVEVRDQGRG
ncbi:MAG: PAS domain S-box protein, partial [Proteobacteria bacterium]|nr:PAS domain S-box protein [Pseudomonadota bacterium]